MPIIHAMTNFSGNAGDSNAVLAVANKIPAAVVLEHKMDQKDRDAVAEFIANTNDSEDHVLVIAGVQGLKFLAQALKEPRMQELIAQKRLVISWSGHQVPKEMAGLEDNLDVVGVLSEAIEFKPAIKETFGARLINMEFVPNTLTKELLESGGPLKTWNATHPDTQIPDAPNGYIAAFLPGDAPDTNDIYKFYSEDDAYALGLALALEAKSKGKFLLATNGPRMGKFDPKSDPSNPKLRATLMHVAGAPMDPVSQRFLEGIRASGLSADQYQFIDFVDKDSAYNAIACAVYKRNAQSEVYYSAESISQAELGQFFANTYACLVNVMSDLHKRFLDRITRLYFRVGIAELHATGMHVISKPDPDMKKMFLSMIPDRDAQQLANAIIRKLKLLQEVRTAGTGKPVTHMQAMAQTETATDAGVVNTSEPHFAAKTAFTA